MNCLNTLRRTAAAISAAAVSEIYPDVLLLGGEVTAVGFTYEFIFPHPIHPHVIEEKMRQIVRERRPIRTLEMVPFSASELLRSKGQQQRVEDIGDDPLVELIQIGDFHDLSFGPHLKNSAELAAFKIVAEPLPEKGMRITGWCHKSKQDLKQFLKQIDSYVEPFRIGESMGLWKGSVWLTAGLSLREKVIQFLRREWFSGAFEIAGPVDCDHFELHFRQNRAKVAEQWAAGHRETYLQISFFSEEMNSPLHLIGKPLTILGFDHSISPEGFEVVDGIGRSQLLARVEKRGNGFTVIAYVERVLEQMLERNLWVNFEN